MTEATREVLEAVKALPPEERQDLIESLFYDQEQPPVQISDAWMEEIRRRTEAIENGAEPLHDWDEACERVEREILGDG